MTRFFFGTFIGRSIGRFVLGLFWLCFMPIVAVMIGGLAALIFAEVLCTAWALINAMLWLPSHNPIVGHQAMVFGLISVVGMGLIVVVQGAVWDAFRVCGRHFGRPTTPVLQFRDDGPHAASPLAGRAQSRPA